MRRLILFDNFYIEKSELPAFDAYVAAAISGFTSTGMATKTIEEHAVNDSVKLAYKAIQIRREILKNAPYAESA